MSDSDTNSDAATSHAESERQRRSEDTNEILARALERYGKRKEARDAQRGFEDDERFRAISTNPFHGMVYAESDPEAARQAVATQLAYDVTLDSGANRTRLTEFERFRGWLMAQRTDMAQQVIRLTDTDAFSQLKHAIDDMNAGMLAFEQQMQPLTSILDAIYRLRMDADGAMSEILDEVKADREEDEAIEAQRSAQRETRHAHSCRISTLQQDIEAQRKRRTWFGLGRVKDAALAEIRRMESEIEAQQAKIAELDEALATEIERRPVRFGEFAEEKAKLRELLDITTEEHHARQQALVESANDFVDMARSRTSQVLRHLERINERIEGLGDANGRLTEAYAVITEAVSDAEARNTTLRDQLLEGPADESRIASMQRGNLKMNVERHVSALGAARAETIETFGDLTAEGYRIKAIRDSNQTQVARAHSLSTKGVAEVASRLSTVLQGVSTAALGESSEIARQTLARMSEQTTRFTHKEALRNAMSISTDNDALVQAIEELEGYAKIARAATEISRDGLVDMRENLSRLELTLAEVVDAVSEATAVGADVAKARAESSKDAD